METIFCNLPVFIWSLGPDWIFFVGGVEGGRLEGARGKCIAWLPPKQILLLMI